MNDAIQRPLTGAILRPLGIVDGSRRVAGGGGRAFHFLTCPELCKPFRIDIAPYALLDFMIERFSLDGVEMLGAPVLAAHLHDLRWMPHSQELRAWMIVSNLSGADRVFDATLQVRIGTDGG